jgi:nucleoside-diphosphate-sugar epimerase
MDVNQINIIQTGSINIRILVIGGNGFIGKHVVNHALDLGWMVTSLNVSDNLSLPHANLEYIQADITNITSLKKALGLAEFEYVVNCGGYIDHTLFSKGGRQVLEMHFTGVINLIELLNQDTLKSFINIGSSDEYGDVNAPQSEIQRESPISPYSLGKVSATHFLQMLFRTEKFPVTILRLFLTYGPGQNSNRFIPQIISGCLKDISFPVSKGEQLRDFCFIDDVIRAIFLVFDSSKSAGEIINIASGKPVSIRYVIENIQNIIEGGYPEFGEIDYRSNENLHLYADVNKAKTLLNWQPKFTLNEGLLQTIQCLKK